MLEEGFTTAIEIERRDGIKASGHQGVGCIKTFTTAAFHCVREASTKRLVLAKALAQCRTMYTNGTTQINGIPRTKVA